MDAIFESSPLPMGLLLLWGTVPGIWLGAAAFCELLPMDRAVRRMLQPAVALAGWIVAVELASMALHSFWGGMPLGMISLSLAGLALWWYRRTAPMQIPCMAHEPGFSRGMWLGMILVSAPIAVMVWNGHFHDDLMPIGSLGTVCQIQNDYFPPHILGFPHVLFRYHYGSDLIFAGVTALTRCRVDTSIRLITIFGWAYSWCLLWVLGQRLTGTRQGGLWVALATLIGGGAAALVAPFVTSMPWTNRLFGMETFGTGMTLCSPTAWLIFQHRFAPGLPLCIATLLLAFEPSANHTAKQSRARTVFFGLFLAALSIAQVTLFITLTATLLFTEVVIARRWQFLAAIVGAWCAAWLMGGMLFTPLPPNAPPSDLYFRFWPTTPSEGTNESAARHALRVLVWHAVTFGALLPLGVWGLWLVRRLRTVLLLMASGCLALPLFFAFRGSGNISKFSSIALVMLGILSGVAIARLAMQRTTIGRIVLALCVATIMATPLTYIGLVLTSELLPQKNLPHPGGPVALSSDDQDAIGWLRTRVKPDELVYRLPELCLGYIQEGGLPSPFLDDLERLAPRCGVWPEQAMRIEQVVVKRPPDLDEYRSIGIRWFVVGPDDPPMERNVRAWGSAGKVSERAKFGQLRIYSLSTPPD